MAEILVTAQELRTKAADLRQQNSNFKTQVGNLETQEGELVSMWEGEARNAFDQAFKNDKNQFDAFYQLIEQYCGALEQIAQKYEQAEGVNLGTATARTY